MTFTAVSSGELIKASVSNANWRHMGRAGMSSFYPMDTSGNYASQDLGETGKEWANGKFTGNVSSATLTVSGAATCSSIATDGQSALKMKVLTASIDGSFADVEFTHGITLANLRGVSNIAFLNPAGTYDGAYFQIPYTFPGDPGPVGTYKMTATKIIGRWTCLDSNAPGITCCITIWYV